ncbi:glycosyltransferase, partial [bacterium]|nr:glycosyltransferase [bacterium]
MNKKLNIVHVVGELDPNDLGGAEIHIVEVIRELLRRGHNLHLFVGADDSCKCLFPFENVKVYPVKYPAIKNLRSFIFAKAARREVLKFLKTHPEIDLVHSKQVFPQGLAGTKICKKTGLPHYLTVQNPLAYIEELVLQIPLLPRFVNQVMQNVLKPLAKKALRGADVIACVSTYSEGRSLAMVPGLKSEIVPNGVDTEKFSPSKQEKNMDAGSVRLCTTSTLIPRNGIDTLIRGFALVAKKHSGAHLDIAGQGPLEADLRKLVKDLDVEKQVTFLGTIKHEEVPALLRKSHLFVRPSRAEGFGGSF